MYIGYSPAKVLDTARGTQDRRHVRACLVLNLYVAHVQADEEIK